MSCNPPAVFRKNRTTFSGVTRTLPHVTFFVYFGSVAMIRVCFLSILMRIMCSCDPSGHLVSRQELDFIPRSALLSSLDRGYRCFSPVGAVNGARKVCSDDIGERTFFVVDGSVPQRGTRMGNPAQARNERSTGLYVVHLWQRSAPKGHTSILCAIIKRYLSTDFCT